MIYRRVTKEDLPKIEKMLRDHGIEHDLSRTPFLGFVAVNDVGDLVGFIYTYSVFLIEPFICENPTAGVKLYYKMEGAISALNGNVIIAHVKSEDEKLDTEIRRAGFQEMNKADYKIFIKTGG
jgi:hypothetical protein